MNTTTHGHIILWSRRQGNLKGIILGHRARVAVFSEERGRLETFFIR